MNFYKDKKVLVTGGTGMIGRFLTKILLERGAEVYVASIDDKSRAYPGAKYIYANLINLNTCLEICEGMDFVFQLAGIKGSPAMTGKKPASFLRSHYFVQR